MRGSDTGLSDTLWASASLIYAVKCVLVVGSRRVLGKRFANLLQEPCSCCTGMDITWHERHQGPLADDVVYWRVGLAWPNSLQDVNAPHRKREGRGYAPLRQCVYISM